MQGLSALAVFATIAVLAGCVPPPVPPINSIAFERRPPLPGQPGYLETIKYIDDGARYIAPNAGFFVSAYGELCFLGSIVPGVTLVLAPHNYWCMSPFAVGTVDALENGVSYINEVRLWCRHASPQCAHKIAYPNMFDTMTVANSIAAQTIPFRHQRAAVEYLVYLMGGAVEPAELLSGGPVPLDTGPSATRP